MKSGVKQWTMRTVVVRALSFAALAALTLHPAPTPAATSDNHADAPITTGTVAASAKMRYLALGVGKSVVIDMPRDIKDVLVADPKIANAVVRSPPARPMSCSSMPRASRWPPMTSRSNATSTACAPR